MTSLFSDKPCKTQDGNGHLRGPGLRLAVIFLFSRKEESEQARSSELCLWLPFPN